MARAIWTGVISFGLVSVPVGLFSAISEEDIGFHQFEAGTSDRIRYKRVNERTGEEVPYDRIVKGADLGGGEYVLVSRDELEAVAPGRSRLLEIQAFVDLDAVDPIYFQRGYYLAPRDETAAKTYALLVQAMTRANRAAIATFVMRTKEYLAAIRPAGDVLTLQTMYFADEVRDPREELPTLPDDVRFQPRELSMSEQLIDSMTQPWEPERYHDTYTERVRELIETKRQGGEVVTQAEAPEATNVVDLMAALRASVETAKRGRGGGGREKTDGDSPEPDLARVSKSELERQARELGVPGRSKMTRQQLAEAVRAARSTRRRAS